MSSAPPEWEQRIGGAVESVVLLRAEQTAPSDDLDDAVDAFLALALSDMGEPHEAQSITLTALAAHLPRYQRSVRSYAQELKP